MLAAAPLQSSPWPLVTQVWRVVPVPSEAVVRCAVEPSQSHRLAHRRLKNRVVAVSEKRGRRRRRWLIALAVVAVVGVWALIVGLKTLSAYRHDKTGLAALEQVKADLSPGDLTSAQSSRLLAQAHAEFVERPVGPLLALLRPHRGGAGHRTPVHRRPRPELGGGNGVRGRIVVHRPGTRPAQSTPRRRTGSADLAAQAQRTVTVGRAPTGRGGHRSFPGPVRLPGRQAQSVRDPALRRPGPSDQGGGGVGGGGRNPAGPPELSGAGGQQCRDAGRIRGLPRRRYGLHLGRLRRSEQLRPLR